MAGKQFILVIKRLILVILTVFAIGKVSLSLVESLGQPQIQSRLELYQTNLILHAAEWSSKNLDSASPPASTPDLAPARNAIIGKDPFKTAQDQYQDALKTAQTTQSKITAKLQELSPSETRTATAPKPTQPQLHYPPVEDNPNACTGINRLMEQPSPPTP